MILLDTNVVSAPMMRVPDSQVIRWLDAQAFETLYISTITIAEMRFGIAALPSGKRRQTLADSFENEILPLFEARILPFDLPASKSYAMLMAAARQAGRAIGTSDGYIAAIAASHGLAIATRDTGPFVAAGLNVINPWIEDA